MHVSKFQRMKINSNSLLSIRSLCSVDSYHTHRRFRSLQRGRKSFKKATHCKHFYIIAPNLSKHKSSAKFLSCSCFFEHTDESMNCILAKNSNISLASSTCSKSKFAVDPYSKNVFVKNESVDLRSGDKNNNFSIPEAKALGLSYEKMKNSSNLIIGSHRSAKHKKVNCHNLSNLLLRLNKFKAAQIRQSSKKPLHRFWSNKNKSEEKQANKTDPFLSSIGKVKHNDCCVLM